MSNDKDFVKAEYYVETEEELSAFADLIAKEQTIGFSQYAETTMWKSKLKSACEKYTGCVADIKEHQDENEKNSKKSVNRGYISIEFPEELFDECGGLPLIMAIVAGQIHANVKAQKVKLVDLDLPKVIVNRFSGPKFGDGGIRAKLNKEKDEPLLGVIMRPNIGLGADEYAEICFEIAKNGADFVKDDEKFVCPDYCPYNKRIPKVTEAITKANKKTGNQTLYIVNITTRPDRLVNNAKNVKELGADIGLIDAIFTGLSAIQGISEDLGIDLPLYGHRVGYALLCRSKDFGIETFVLLKLLRLVGVDMLSVGIIGGAQGARKSDIRNNINATCKNWFNIKPILPICTAGMFPGIVPHNIDLYGTTNIAIFGAWGIHGHPDGVGAGVRAMKQAITATLQGEPLDEFKGEELKKALETFGLPPTPSKKTSSVDS